MNDEQDELDEDDLEEWEDFESLEDRIRGGPLLGILLWTALIAGAVLGSSKRRRPDSLCHGLSGALQLGAWRRSLDLAASCERHRQHLVPRCSRLIRAAVAPSPPEF
jgi:hypothetical protein